MYGNFYGFDDGRSKILTLDLSTGGTTDFGDFDSAAGIITGAVAATPEPAPVALAIIGLGSLLIWWWGRHSCLPCPDYGSTHSASNRL